MSGNSNHGVDAILDRLSRDLAYLRQLAEERHSADQVQKQAFDQLYEEMRRYKEDFVFQTEKPLLLDLLLFYDSLNWFKESLLKKEMSPDVVADSFQYLLDEFLELLYRRDVLPLESRPSFDRTTQKAIKVVATDVREDDYRVEQVVKRGFTRAGRLLRAEEVVLARFRGDGSPEFSGE